MNSNFIIELYDNFESNKVDQRCDVFMNLFDIPKYYKKQVKTDSILKLIRKKNGNAFFDNFKIFEAQEKLIEDKINIKNFLSKMKEFIIEFEDANKTLFDFYRWYWMKGFEICDNFIIAFFRAISNDNQSNLDFYRELENLDIEMLFFDVNKNRIENKMLSELAQKSKIEDSLLNTPQIGKKSSEKEERDKIEF